MQRNVLEYLEETVKRVPDKIAFANDKTQLTFQQFSDDIRAIGSELIRKGYQKEPVLIYMNKSPKAAVFMCHWMKRCRRDASN